MKDIYETEIDIITLVIIPKAIGSIIGASLAGILLDKFPKSKYFILSGITLIVSICTAVLPHGSHLWMFFLASVVSSFGAGGLDTGGNVLCLDTWSDGEAGPYMHSIHFSFALGAFLAPLISIPFLSQQSDELGVFQQKLNETMMEPTETQVTWLYPILGIFGLVCACFYLILALTKCQNANVHKDSKKKEEKAKRKLTLHQWMLLALMIAFFFFYVGSEVTYGLFLPAYCVKSRLKLSKQTGAEITAVFWGFFAAMRFFSIFASIYLKPIYIMGLSCGFSCLSGIMLSIWGDQNQEILWVGSAMMGFGIASIYATGLLWLESFVTITNRIGAAMTVASSIGADLFPVISGQLLEKYPMTLMYITCGTIIFTSLMFVLAVFIGSKIDKNEDSSTEKKQEENQEMMNVT